MNIKTIKEIDKISEIPYQALEHVLWATDETIAPKTEFRMAVVENKGLVVEYKVYEKNPERTFTVLNDPVYLESAVEFFINIDNTKEREYFNFEINSLGTFLARYGEGRKRRPYYEITKSMEYLPTTWASVNENDWTLRLFVPSETFDSIGKRSEGYIPFNEKTSFKFNAYKINEKKGEEHFEAFSFVDVPEPDFHRPEFFAKAIIEK